MVERRASSDEPVYGVSTGFGSLAGTWIPPERREELQRALIRSHAAGMGPPIEREAVRAMMFLRARSLAMGRSGARPVVAETMLALLAAGLDPVVPEYGSLGASGDLAPLAHCGLALLGEGEVWTAGDERVPARRGDGGRGHRGAHAHAEGGPRPDQRHRRHPRDAAARSPRPGPALADGGRDRGHVHGGAARHRPRFRRRPRAHAPPARPGAQRRQPHAAAGRLADRGEPPLRRPARAGRVLAALRAAGERGGARHRAHVESVAAAELRSAIDNPVVLPDGRVESCGNFHGAPVAMACDFLAIAAAEVGAIAERRTDRMLDQAARTGCRRSWPRTRA